MFKIKKLTKYTFFALTIAFVIFVAIPNSAKAGDDDYFYESMGWEDMSNYDYSSYQEPTYYNEPSYSQPSYYNEPTYYDEPSYYPEPTSYYPEPTYYDEPSYDYYDGYSYDYYQPSYSYSQPSYSYSGCTSCGYTYTPPPQIVYIPQSPPVIHPPVVPPIVPPVVVPPTLNASCIISPNNVYINDSVTLSASASGGTGSYNYFWSGSDGISGSSQVITGRFTSIGSKTVSLTVTSGSQTITRTCNAYVNQRYNNDYNYYPPYNYNYPNLNVTCSAQPSVANVGDNVIWTAYPNGGNGSYTYSWTGTDGLSYGNSYQIQQRYSIPGTKTATITVYSTNGQSVTATCNANINGAVRTIAPASGIYLNEVPATGISFNVKVALYILGLILWSAFVGIMIVQKKKAKFALANKARIEDFKQENLKRKGIL